MCHLSSSVGVGRDCGHILHPATSIAANPGDAEARSHHMFRVHFLAAVERTGIHAALESANIHLSPVGRGSVVVAADSEIMVAVFFEQDIVGGVVYRSILTSTESINCGRWKTDARSLRY